MGYEYLEYPSKLQDEVRALIPGRAVQQLEKALKLSLTGLNDPVQHSDLLKQIKKILMDVP